jgi:UDP-N-acetylglucosamine 4,6-dehydratase/5-epimerase
MTRVLITGGSGTIGEAFIRQYYDQYEFTVVSRNESLQHRLRMTFPKVSCYICDIQDLCAYSRIVGEVKPDIVIHAAAIKHVDIAENQPIQTVNVNIIGSLNVIEVSVEHDVPLTVAISTDKACEHSNIYGMSKYLMERCFLEANSSLQKFAVCRFGNVAYSNGSVLPFWKKLAASGLPLKVTDPRMNRLMFSQGEAAALIHRTIDLMSEEGGFVLSKKMKNVNMLDLAKAISSQVELVGIRPGEKLDENLVSAKELPYTSVVDDYIKITKNENPDIKTRLFEPYNTKTAESMSVAEIQSLINSQ